MTTTLLNLAHLLDAELTNLRDIDSLPPGSVVIDGEGTAWQRALDGYWHAATASRRFFISSDLRYACGPSLLLKWLPPEAMGR